MVNVVGIYLEDPLSFAEALLKRHLLKRETDLAAPKAQRARSARKEGKERKPLPNNRMTLLQLSISRHKMVDRVVHAAFLENKVVCSLCFYKDKVNKIKTFARNDGLKQHFRTIHRQRFTEQTIADCETLTNHLHGEETRKHLLSMMMASNKSRHSDKNEVRV